MGLSLGPAATRVAHVLGPAGATAADAGALEAIGAALARCVGAGDIVLLAGDLGAGKTTLVRGLCQTLGIAPAAVQSPTFALVHTYEGAPFAVHHLDLYRVADAAELEAAGLVELLDEPGALVLVEWPDVAGPFVRPGAVRLQLQVRDDGGRSVACEGDPPTGS